MTLPEFSVSEARVAITCPRILYFDRDRARRNPGKPKRVTRIWVDAKGGVSGCGKLFHDTIERFNGKAEKDPAVSKILCGAVQIAESTERRQYVQTEFKRLLVQRVNRAILIAKPPEQILAFDKAVDTYLREVAEIVSYALGQERDIPKILGELFGDSRKRVDVSIKVRPNQHSVRVRGSIDYIYYDWLQKQQRIIDYKLMPAVEMSHDILQVALYGLMHDQQHQTRASVAVVYLHPEKSIVDRTWDGIHKERYKVYDHLASMADWVEYDETKKKGLKPPGELSACGFCPWNKNGQCEKRLGPKSEGERRHHWADAALASSIVDPLATALKPPEIPPTEEYDDFDEEEATGGEPSAADEREQPEPVDIESKDESPIKPDVASGLWLGATVAGKKGVFLPAIAMNTHIAVMGAAGSGKTWLAKVVAEEAIRQGVPVLAIDPQGDLVQFLHRSELPEGASAADREAHATFREMVEPRIWTPGSSHATRLTLSPMKLPRESDLTDIADPKRRHEEWESMLAVVAGNLVSLAGAGGDDELQATFLLELLRCLTVTNEFREKPLGLNEIAASAMAPEDVGLEDPDQFIPKAQREKVGRKLLARIKGPSKNLFTGGTPLDIGAMCQPAASGKVPLNVIYLNALADDGQKQSFVAALAAEVYRWMITTASSGATRLLFYLDEAKDYLPAGTSKPPAKPPLLRLFAQGRKYGVSCLICTQSPRSVDYNIFSNASTKLIGRLEASQDVARVAEWFANAGGTPSWLAGRNGAAKGTWVGRWPDMPSDLDGVEFKSRLLFSRHEGAWSPDKVEQEVAAMTTNGRQPAKC